MYKSFKKKRNRMQLYTSLFLPAVIIGGWFYPVIGFSLLICMAGAVGLSFYNGRSWCDWMCPRGSFYDLFLDKVSRNIKIPVFFKSNWFRATVLTALMTVLGVQIYFAWGDSVGIGLAFVIVLTVTTTAGIVLGAFFKPRAWCQICPMGSLSSWISQGRNPLYVTERCKECSLCEKVCPMQLSPHKHKQSVMSDGDCIKCSSCVAVCPANALEFREIKKAA